MIEGVANDRLITLRDLDIVHAVEEGGLRIGAVFHLGVNFVFLGVVLDARDELDLPIQESKKAIGLGELDPVENALGIKIPREGLADMLRRGGSGDLLDGGVRRGVTESGESEGDGFHG